MLPGVLLLWAWWRHGRIGRETLRAVAPFFAAAAVFGLITIWFQHHRAIGGTALPAIGLLARAVNAGRGAAFYFCKALWPADLSPIYPRWVDGPAAFLPLILLCAGLAAAWWQRATWGRTALFGLGFFLLNLLPVLGLIRMSYEEIAPVADHFAYVSLAGLAGLAAAGLGAWRPAGRRFLPLGAALVAVGWLAVESRNYARAFANQETLWTLTLERNPASATAHNNLGAVFLRQQRWSEAARELTAALALDPRSALAHLNLGNALVALERPAEAGAHYEAALRLDPAGAEAHFNLANLLAQGGRIPAAIAHYREALRLGPDSVDVRTNLANALVAAEQFDEAMTHYRAALALQPAAFAAQFNLGNLLAATGHFPEAVEHFAAAVRLEPASADARAALADAQAAAYSTRAQSTLR
jgi:tetratricopeptide (TPR) repeat protein